MRRMLAPPALNVSPRTRGSGPGSDGPQRGSTSQRPLPIRVETLREQGFSPDAARTALELHTGDTRPEPYSQRYKYLAVDVFLKGEISEGQLLRFLRVHRVRAREIVEECRRQYDITEDGEPLSYSLPLEQSVMV